MENMIDLKKRNIGYWEIARKYHVDRNNWGRAINQLHGYIHVIYRERLVFVKTWYRCSISICYNCNLWQL